jgi:hypothetical protein
VSKAFDLVPRELLLSKIEKNTRLDSRGCLVWTGSCHPYGAIHFNHKGQRYWPQAHVVAWELANNISVPANLFVLHSCDNPPCVLPAHLRLGSAAENTQDMMERNRSPVGEQSKNAKLTEKDVRIIRSLVGVVSYAVIAKSFGVSRTQVHHIATGKAWRHVVS